MNFFINHFIYLTYKDTRKWA